MGHPLNDLCVRKVPFMCPVPSQPGVGQLIPSNLMEEAVETGVLCCCSIVPPFSKALILFRLAIGQPDALQVFLGCLLMKMNRGTKRKEDIYLRCDKNFPVE